MELEIEAKVPISPETARRIYSELDGLLEWEAIRETNTLYDTNGILASRGKTLRLRTATSEKSAPVVTLTYKGPTDPNAKYKSRPEINIDLHAHPDQKNIQLLVESVGYGKVFYYEKLRFQTEFRNCHICLDELPAIGLFLEIEGHSEEEINTVLAELGVTEPSVSRGYPALLAEYAASHPEIKTDGKDHYKFETSSSQIH